MIPVQKKSEVFADQEGIAFKLPFVTFLSFLTLVMQPLTLTYVKETLPNQI